MIDTSAILARVDLVALVEKYTRLKKAGKEWMGLCPFHEERSPSFTVAPDKGFVHCFGCGAHHNAIGVVMELDGKTFLEACEALGGDRLDVRERKPIVRALRSEVPGAQWIPTIPPEDAPQIMAGEKIALWNPKRDRLWYLTPTRADIYRDLAGRRIGYVLRVEFDDGKKVTPQVTWCIGPDGKAQWCTRPFLSPKPLCGLDELAAKPQAPVLIVEGEKCRAAGAGALPMYAVLCWPGGSKAVPNVDWSPLAGCDVVLWPDADAAGWSAMLGEEHSDGRVVEGVAQHAVRAHCASARVIDTRGMPKGWDIADALNDGWTPRQLAAWAASRVIEVDVRFESNRKAA